MIRFRRPRGAKNQLERLRALTQYEFYYRFREGRLTEADYFRAMTATEDDRVMEHVYREIRGTGHEGNGYNLQWEDIIAWIQEHGDDILKIVLSIALLFAGEKSGNGQS